MKLRPIASTGVRISPIGLGTVKLGRDQGVKYPEPFQIPDDRAASSLLAKARDLGINLIDTAPAYGSSEERLGKLLRDQRDDWVICSKVGEEFHNGHSFYNYTANYVRECLVRSLQRLETDYIDLYLVHSNGNDVEIIERYGILEQLAEFKKEGLIRAYGMSTKTVEGGLLAAQNADLVMLTYNLEHQAEEPILDYCAEHNTGTLIKKAFASGHLCNHIDDPVQDSMDFVFHHPGATSIVVGTINEQHLEQNVAAANRAINSRALS